MQSRPVGVHDAPKESRFWTKDVQPAGMFQFKGKY
jgi:hypothetical protein